MTNGHDALDALRGALDERATATDGVERVASGEAVEYRLRGRAVVVADPGSISFRVGGAVAAAAARTADARISGRGADWVELVPAAADRFALDRARAWFDLAVRNAGEGARRVD